VWQCVSDHGVVCVCWEVRVWLVVVGVVMVLNVVDVGVERVPMGVVCCVAMKW